ncbi:MAG: hypothetical protein J0H98_02090 [Solirubrobacterales bacterium]|nr:hypothetical protein [Solirubrobacterales bacterium]
MPLPRVPWDSKDYGLILEWEERLRELRDARFAPARRKTAPSPAPVDDKSIRRELSQTMGVDRLTAELGSSTTPPVAPPTEPIDQLEILTRARAVAVASISRWNPLARWRTEGNVLTEAAASVELEKERRLAERDRAQADLDEKWERLRELLDELDTRTMDELDAERERRARQQAEEQERLDLEWDALLNNEEREIRACLATTERRAAVNFELLAVTGSTAVTRVWMTEPDTLIPERHTGSTPGGRPSVKKRNKTERNETHLELLAVATVNVGRQVLACAPGIRSVIVVTASIARPADSLTMARIARDEVEPTDFSCNIKGRTNEVHPIDDPSVLARYPEHPLPD